MPKSNLSNNLAVHYSHVKLVQELFVVKDGRNLKSSHVTVLADNYDDALQALLDYRNGKIKPEDITRQGIDVRKRGADEHHTSNSVHLPRT